MAHPNKFVSVNLNKSYGKPASSSSSASNARSRGGPHSSASSTGGGMLILSRPRSSSSSSSILPKSSAPKLSVPPPLNLPSLRKESEKSDHSNPGGSSARPGSSGIGSGHGASTMGWTKPAPFLQEKDTAAASAARSCGAAAATYVPPSARPPSSSPVATVEKAVFLRGEDFPSLKAATFTSPNPKQKEEREKPAVRSPLPMRPQISSSRLVSNKAADAEEQPQNQQLQDKYLPGPLPLVKLTRTSDWADDERDTGLNLPERDRDRDRGFSRADYGRIDDERDFYRGESFAMNKDGRDVVNSWRGPPPPSSSLPGFDRDRYRPKPHFPYGDSPSNGNQDSQYPRRDLGIGANFQTGKNLLAEGFPGRGNEQQSIRSGLFGDASSSRYRVDSFTGNTSSKVPFSAGSKGLSVNDPILNFGRDNKLNSRSGKSYLVDSGFGSTDPFSDDPIGDVNVKVFKRKKEALEQTDFHDPVRASFEAELERVQRIQEQERQQAMEEQTRAMELARREHEERERLVREEEERRRLIEEEAREAAWRAEHEKMEVVKRAEEQKLAREEEKRRIIMEEERRKEAARKKLLELEARIARRQTETHFKDDSILGETQVPDPAKERDVPKVTSAVGDWEDGERMVEHITSTTSSDSQHFEAGSSRFHSSRDGNTSFMEKEHGNHFNRDTYEIGSSSLFHLQDQDGDFYGSRRDAFSSGRPFLRKDKFGGFPKGGSSEYPSLSDDLRYSRGNRWNVGGDGDHFSSNLDVDATDFLDDKFGDGGWGSGRSRGSPHAPSTEREFQNEVDGGFSSFGRSRLSLRQPRVLPPPSISSMHHILFRNEGNSPGPTSFLDSQSRYHSALRREGEIMQSGHGDGYHKRDQALKSQELLETDDVSSERKEERESPRCDSQSSLSVSNPPTSPTGFDDAEDTPALLTSVVEEHTFVSDNEHVASETMVVNTNMVVTSSLVSHREDDEWEIENNEEMNEQEDYDEEVHGSQEEEEEVHDVNGDETLEFGEEFDDPPSDLPNRTGNMDLMISHSNEVVEVSISTDGHYEKTCRDHEKGTGVQEDLVGDNSFQDVSTFTEGSVSETSKIMNETGKALQDLNIEPLPTSTSNSPDSFEASGTRGMLLQQPISSLSLPMPSTSIVQSATSTVPSVDNQAEAPIRLQFGLFSGPSLIPSPVPAIQIGSIQMPLIHSQLHPPQTPFFHFGQLRYPSPLSQGILPLSLQTMSIVHPPVSAQNSSTQNLGGFLHSQVSQTLSSQNSAPDKVPSRPLVDQEGHPGTVTGELDLSRGSRDSKQLDELANPLKGDIASQGQTYVSSVGGDKTQHVSSCQNEQHILHDATVRKNYRPVSHSKEPQVYPGHVQSQMPNGERTKTGSRVPGTISSIKGKRFTYTSRNANMRPLFPAPDTIRTDSSGFERRPRRSARRTEFRVRENFDRREREVMESCSNVVQDGRPNFNGRVSGSSGRYGVRKGAVPTKLTKAPIESESLNSGVSRVNVVSSGGKMDQLSGKETLSKKRATSPEAFQVGKGSGKNNASSEEDVAAPLQSGVVCVFRQAGIEIPSDEDDFIEVRSRRQMLNDRREQREKEIKAKSKVVKPSRKHRAVPHSDVVSYTFKKSVASRGGGTTNALHSDTVITDGRGFPSMEAAPIFSSNMTTHTQSPIGTPAPKVDSDAKLKSSQTSCIPVTSTCATKFLQGLPFENKNTGPVNASLPSGSWSTSDINQQVMTLTQSQLDDAMKPVQFDSHVASSISLEATKSSSSMAHEKSPSTCPLSSLLAGERIQFGAVTSPTILPTISQAVSNGISPLGSSSLDVSEDHVLTATDNDCTVFCDKERHTDESCTHLKDTEAEAEAAASAVAVAAITNNDEIVSNGLGACSVSDSNTFTDAENTELTSADATASKEVTSRSVAEESLSVALPADLSVDTPLQLWHPLPSPQGTSGPMLSHFPQPSHFPIVDMNPIFGGPKFSFGPNDELGSSQAQPPRSTTLGSGPPGPWPQCHSGVDSFYGPHTGFAGPYISPAGGIRGVQAPPHMVVYNHFSPVGQFGQVGLSFMGTTYIPTGKQSDWKHNPVPSATTVASEGEITNLNVASVQRSPSNMHSPIQHLAPGSPLMSMAPPLPIFDMSPYQPPTDVPFQARWSHVPDPSIHSIPLTMPPPQPQQWRQQHQQQVEGDMHSQFGRSIPVDTSTTTEPPVGSTSNVQTKRTSYNLSSANNMKGSNGLKGSSRSAACNANDTGNGGKIVGSSFKAQTSRQQLAIPGQQQLIHPVGYGGRRGAAKIGSGGEWHRRDGYQGRGHGSGPDKGFGPSKMKQIYVAKVPSSGSAATG